MADISRATEDSDLSDEQRALLLAVVTYFQATNTEETHKSIMEAALIGRRAELGKRQASADKSATVQAANLPEDEVEQARRNFRNFVQKLGEQGAGLIFDHFRNVSKRK